MIKSRLHPTSWLPGAFGSLVLAFFLSLPALAAVTQVVNTVTVTADNQDPAQSSTTVASVLTVIANLIAVPTLSGAVLVAMALLLAGVGVFLVRRRRAAGQPPRIGS